MFAYVIYNSIYKIRTYIGFFFIFIKYSIVEDLYSLDRKCMRVLTIILYIKLILWFDFFTLLEEVRFSKLIVLQLVLQLMYFLSSLIRHFTKTIIDQITILNAIYFC